MGSRIGEGDKLKILKPIYRCIWYSLIKSKHVIFKIQFLYFIGGFCKLILFFIFFLNERELLLLYENSEVHTVVEKCI